MAKPEPGAHSADSRYGASEWQVITAKSSTFAGLFRWFAVPVLPDGTAVDDGEFFGGSGYETELGALEAGIEAVRRRGLKPNLRTRPPAPGRRI